MEPNLKTALERIKELESLSEDQQIVIDLQHEDLCDKETLIRSLRGQLQNLMIDRRYEVA